MEVLDQIPVQLDLDQVLQHLQIGQESKYLKKIQDLIEIAHLHAKPKVLFKVAYVDQINETSLKIGGVQFRSRVLRINLKTIERVFPYIATCGTELDEITVPSQDLLQNLCLDTLKRLVLRKATQYLEQYLAREYALGQLSKMNPGSLDDWPITQQKALFALFPNVEELIGVRLTEHFLMRPLKSISGIYFPTQIKFESCQLCPRERCRERRALYEPKLKKPVYGIN
jgi:hypothetical protein